MFASKSQNFEYFNYIDSRLYNVVSIVLTYVNSTRLLVSLNVQARLIL